LRWPARPGLSSLSPDSFYRRLKTPRFAIQGKVVRSEDQNNAHDKHRPGKLEYFVKDAITRCCGWLSAYSSDYGPSTFQKKMSPPNSLCGKEWRCSSWLFPLDTAVRLRPLSIWVAQCAHLGDRLGGRQDLLSA